ncbi:MAG: hypothetical protein JWM85_3134 [Acidimicrobiaceae bacterium]|nr:hypothetical protein [Acidimicrobiaceae bacterium]
MSDFGPQTYGEPCHGCGFSWGLDPCDAISVVKAAPDDFAVVLAGASGAERHPDLMWSVGAYVCHVVDNLRIWAERLAGAPIGADATVTSYDNELLAKARRYDGVALNGALWSLRRAADDWVVAVREAGYREVVLEHPDRGTLSVLDVARTNAHDVHHHLWDVVRSLKVTPS